MYRIIIHNQQGASDVYTAETQKEIDAWLKDWQDPENLTARVYTEGDHQIAYKPTGRKTLDWTYRD